MAGSAFGKSWSEAYPEVHRVSNRKVYILPWKGCICKSNHRLRGSLLGEKGNEYQVIYPLLLTTAFSQDIQSLTNLAKRCMYITTRKSKYSIEPPRFYLGFKLRQTPLVPTTHSPTDSSHARSPLNSHHSYTRHLLRVYATLFTPHQTRLCGHKSTCCGHS